MTPYHPLVETAAPPEGAFVIWPWPNNWSEPFTQRLEYKTAVLPSASSREQRRALREVPRETFIVNNLLEHPDSATALALLRAWKGKSWLVPGWHEMARTLAPAGQVLQLDRFSARPGPALLGTEVVEVVNSSGTLAVSPSGSWPAGTALVPLYEALLDEDQTAEFVTAGVARLSVAFQVTQGRAVPSELLGVRPVWPASASAVSDSTQRVVGRYGGGLAASAAGGMTLQRSGGFAVTGDQTFETWVFLPSLFDGTRALFELSSSGGWDVTASRTAPGSLTYRVQVSLNNEWGYFDDLQVGRWYHLAATAGSGGDVRMYRDGALVRTFTHPPLGAQAPALRAFLLEPGVGRPAFPGYVDDVRLTSAVRYSGNFLPAQCPVGAADPFWASVQLLVPGDDRSRWAQTLPAWGDPMSFRTHHLPDDHNWRTAWSAAASRPIDTLDPGLNLRHTRPAEKHAALSWRSEFLLPDLQDILAFRAWLQAHRGAAVSFYACPPGQDVTVTAVAGAVVTAPELRFFTAPAEVFTHLALRVAGEWEYRAISSIAGASVTLASAPSGMPDAARLVTRARILGDAVELRYHSLGVAEVSLPLTTAVE